MKRTNTMTKEQLEVLYPVGTKITLKSTGENRTVIGYCKGALLARYDIVTPSGRKTFITENVDVKDVIPSKDPVVVSCGGEEKTWEDRPDAILYFHQGVLECEGSEQSRYACILADLMAGKAYCTDNY